MAKPRNKPGRFLNCLPRLNLLHIMLMSDYTIKEEPPRKMSLNFPFVPAMFPPKRIDGDGAIPNMEECAALWDKYSMLPNIREHCGQVALVAGWLGARLEEKGITVNRPLMLAGALLHDLAKSYTIKNGGSHAQLGAGWVVQETGNYQLAQMVFHHVNWPWALDINNESMLPSLLVVYADKRVKHDCIVTLEERFDDLFKRYGVNATARMYIAASREQGLVLEKDLSKLLGVAVDEYTFDCRRLV